MIHNIYKNSFKMYYSYKIIHILGIIFMYLPLQTSVLFQMRTHEEYILFAFCTFL